MKYSAEQQRFLTQFRFPINAYENLLKVLMNWFRRPNGSSSSSSSFVPAENLLLTEKVA